MPPADPRPTDAATAAPARGAQRAYWLKTLHQWHWISSAASLVALLMFAITGITLNHASQIEAKPQVTTRKLTLTEPLKAMAAAKHEGDNGPLPDELARWVETQLRIEVDGVAAEWSAEEIYLPLPRPGGDAWLRIDRAEGTLEYERTDRGWISYLNDLHKGRHTGTAWNWLIDLFAVACLLFAITGLFILKMHAAKRPSTWPIVVFGLVLPWLVVILFVH